MRLLVDMNLSPSWVPFLQKAGLEALHWSAVGAPDAPDHALMQWAAAQNYVVMTNDLDFSAILAATGRQKPSVIQLRADLLTPAAIGCAVVRALEQTRAELVAGALVSIDPSRARVRILPLEV
jgi:predicted nuclease of predicted toxin-antitoxin system